MPEINITRGYCPGSIGRVAELHGTYYHNHWGFGLFFEAKVATELSGFLKRYDESRDGFWVVQVDSCIQGAITIDGIHAENQGAHLRWFIMSDRLRGKGIGNHLISTAIGFCRKNFYKKVYLWTFKGLDAAKHLYEKSNFKLVESHSGVQWGIEVQEQRYELLLKSHL